MGFLRNSTFKNVFKSLMYSMQSSISFILIGASDPDVNLMLHIKALTPHILPQSFDPRH